MNKQTILIVEDELYLCNLVDELLSKHYKTIKASTGQEALSITASHCPDMILLDLGLPDMDGINVLRKIRTWSSLPILALSERILEAETVLALDSGADDYIRKPFGTSELLARIRTAFRHCMYSEKISVKPNNKLLQICDLTIDFEKRLVKLRDIPIHITQIEFKILKLLAQNAGHVLTYETIILSIWGPYADKNNQILRVNMANIRRKIESDPSSPKYILTENGVGYRMIDGKE
mgnify:CR=1 FL=1